MVFFRKAPRFRITFAAPQASSARTDRLISAHFTLMLYEIKLFAMTRFNQAAKASTKQRQWQC
jgi:hypothetical protein